MNGIRLAVFALAAICFFQLDLSDAPAQDRDFEGEANRARAQGMGYGLNSPRKPKTDDSDQSKPPSRSRRNNSRSNTSDGNNVIKTNPLFQLFDENGDGELSLAEIDAASRILYSLDGNEDDRITADEVEDMVAEGGSPNSREPGADRDSNERGSRGSEPNTNRAAAGGRPGRGGARGPVGALTSVDGTPTRGKREEPGAGRGGARGERGAVAALSSVDGTPTRGKKEGGAGRSGAPGAAMALGSVDGTPTRGKKEGGPADDDFAGNDRDGDGVLKRGELPSKMRKDFRKMDANRDGELSEDEFYDYIDKN